MCSINHEKKAIFIHNPKVAGIYLRNALEDYYGFSLYLFKREDHEEYCKTDLTINGNSILYFANKYHGIINYYKSSKYLSELMDMDDEKWKEYKKFIFIRNPYERIVSGWNYCMEVNKLNIDFSKYLNFKDKVTEDEYLHVFLPQYSHIIDENNIKFIDYIGHFENLENDFKDILIKIGFAENEIIHEKKYMNKRLNKNYKKYYDSQETLDKVNEILDIDFKNLPFNKIHDIKYFYECL